jgi:enoyl-CoA hydratase/carnithine racemase
MNEEVYFTEEAGIGHVWLNSPRTLNALSVEIISKMTAKLKHWEDVSHICAVAILSNHEKSFCAGGDVVSLYKAMVSGKPPFEFFEKEYHLDFYIHQYKKPVIVLADGIVMGGGIGIMNGASHRIVTEKSLLAMPEITIGLFPDVGGSYFLNQMPDGVGKFLALTGVRFNATDALWLKLADYFISCEQLVELKKALAKGPFNRSQLDDLLEKFAAKEQEKRPDGEIEKRFGEIKELASPETIEEIYDLWGNYQSKDPWINKAIGNFLKGSPTSAAVMLEQLKRGSGFDLKQCFAMELTMAKQFCLHHDFQEGVRALLIDRDFKPDWKPNNIRDVNRDLVLEHFKEN